MHAATIYDAGGDDKLMFFFTGLKVSLIKIETNSTSECFITLKDHKEKFVNNPKTRLINEIGRISKDILDSINEELRNNLQLNQWKNSVDVINWFNPSTSSLYLT